MTRAETQNSDLMKKYAEMNRIADKGGVVFFGSNHLAKIPVSELGRSFRMQEALYNRSVADTCISELQDTLHTCVLDLEPEKVFVNLGDADLQQAHLNMDDFIAKYEWLLYSIHTRTNAKIYVVSVLEDTPTARRMNTRLKRLAAECGSDYVDVTEVLDTDRPEVRTFELLKAYIRSRLISFSEAMVQ